MRVKSLARSYAQAGSIAAQERAHKREVSTSSAAITHAGVDDATEEAGKRAKCVPRAP